MLLGIRLMGDVRMACGRGGDCRDGNGRDHQRHFYETCGGAADPIAGQVTSPMRCGHEYDALDIGSMIKNKRLFNDLALPAINGRLCGRLPENVEPNLVAGISNHEATDHPTHAVANEHDAFMMGEGARDPIQFLTKKRRRIGVGITARITVNPELIAPANLGIGTQGVDHRCPTRGRVLQTMNKNHRRTIGIVRLQSREPRGVGIFVRTQKPDEPELLRALMEPARPRAARKNRPRGAGYVRPKQHGRLRMARQTRVAPCDFGSE